MNRLVQKPLLDLREVHDVVIFFGLHQRIFHLQSQQHVDKHCLRKQEGSLRGLHLVFFQVDLHTVDERPDTSIIIQFLGQNLKF